MSSVGLGIRCPCGLELIAGSEEALVKAVNAHLSAEHPRVAGSYDDGDILALSYPKRVP